MLRALLKSLVFAVAIPIVVYLALIAIGGGLGDKPPLPTTFAEAKRPVLFAHRGAVGPHAENSLAAIDEAARLGFPAVEIDLQFSADRQFILFHDRTTERLLGIQGVASSMTIDELRRKPLLLERLPTTDRVAALTQVTDRWGDSLLFYFDMKRHGHDDLTALAADIAGYIAARNLQERVIVASASPWLIAIVEYRHPDLITALEGIDNGTAWSLSWIPRRFKPDMIASRHAAITDDFAKWLRDSGWASRYVTYHVPAAEFRRTVAMGIELMIVDYGEHLDATLVRK